METITVLHNQSFLDLAIQHTGSVENCFAMAAQNGISVSDHLASGSSLVIGNIGFNKDILNYYTSKKIKPATAWLPATEGEGDKKGIGQMQIGSSFKVYE